jgi:hypothetical protein
MFRVRDQVRVEVRVRVRDQFRAGARSRYTVKIRARE